jgi:hypothetical protein
VAGLHGSSITCIRLMPEQGMMVTGSGSGMVQCFGVGGQQAWCTPVGSGGVLSLAVHPQAAEGQPYIAVGTMGGAVSLVDSRSGDLLACTQAHSKYVVRVLWCAGGQRLMSASWDQSIAVLGLQQLEGQLELRTLAKVSLRAAAATPQAGGEGKGRAEPSKKGVLLPPATRAGALPCRGPRRCAAARRRHSGGGCPRHQLSAHVRHLQPA